MRKEVALGLAAAAAFVVAVRGRSGQTGETDDAGTESVGVDPALIAFLLSSLASAAVAPSG